MVVNGVPEIVYEHMSNALVKAGYFPGDPADPFLLEIVWSLTADEDGEDGESFPVDSPLNRLRLVAAVESAMNAAKAAEAPCVCCTIGSSVHLALAHGAKWVLDRRPFRPCASSGHVEDDGDDGDDGEGEDVNDAIRVQPPPLVIASVSPRSSRRS